MNTDFSVKRAFWLYKNLLISYRGWIIMTAVGSFGFTSYHLLSEPICLSNIWGTFFAVLAMVIFYVIYIIHRTVHSDIPCYFTIPCRVEERCLSFLYFFLTMLAVFLFSYYLGLIIYNILAYDDIHRYLLSSPSVKDISMLPFGSFYIPNIFKIAWGYIEHPAASFSLVFFFFLLSASFCSIMSFKSVGFMVSVILLVHLSLLWLTQQDSFFGSEITRNESGFIYLVRTVWASVETFRTLYFIIYSAAFVLLMYASFLKLKEKENR